jgi:hypothetical protein
MRRTIKDNVDGFSRFSSSPLCNLGVSLLVPNAFRSAVPDTGVIMYSPYLVFEGTYSEHEWFTWNRGWRCHAHCKVVCRITSDHTGQCQQAPNHSHSHHKGRMALDVLDANKNLHREGYRFIGLRSMCCATESHVLVLGLSTRWHVDAASFL